MLFIFDMMFVKQGGVIYSVAYEELCHKRWGCTISSSRLVKLARDGISVWHFNPHKYSLSAQNMLLSLLFLLSFVFVALNSFWSAQRLNSSLKYALRVVFMQLALALLSAWLFFFPAAFPCHQRIFLKYIQACNHQELYLNRTVSV